MTTRITENKGSHGSPTGSRLGCLAVLVWLCWAQAALAASGSNLGSYATHFTPAVVSGTVTGADGSPVSGATVTTVAGHRTITGADGTYTLYLDAPGIYSVAAAKGGNRVSGQAEVTLSATSGLDLQLPVAGGRRRCKG